MGVRNSVPLWRHRTHERFFFVVSYASIQAHALPLWRHTDWAFWCFELRVLRLGSHDETLVARFQAVRALW
jgi:hypothetical protein